MTRTVRRPVPLPRVLSSWRCLEGRPDVRCERKLAGGPGRRRRPGSSAARRSRSAEGPMERTTPNRPVGGPPPRPKGPGRRRRRRKPWRAGCEWGGLRAGRVSAGRGESTARRRIMTRMGMAHVRRPAGRARRARADGRSDSEVQAVGRARAGQRRRSVSRRCGLKPPLVSLRAEPGRGRRGSRESVVQSRAGGKQRPEPARAGGTARGRAA